MVAGSDLELAWKVDRGVLEAQGPERRHVRDSVRGHASATGGKFDNFTDACSTQR
jgi:hypothetical protein